VDMWSIGTTLAELYTGKILFNGQSNNEMLKQFMDYRGPFPKKLLRKATFRAHHFEELGAFIAQDIDPISKKNVVRVISDIRASKDITNYLIPNRSKLTDKEYKKVLEFRDLLDKMFALDPAKRITPQDALLHPFLVPSPK